MLPRVFARPLELRRGQSLTDRQLIDRLNDLGYAQRANAREAGRVRDRRRRRSRSCRARRSSRASSCASCSSDRRRPTCRKAPRAAPPPRPADRVLRLELGARPSERLDARRAAADVAHRRRAREAPARRAVGDPAARDAGGARDRGSALLLSPRRRSDRHRRRGPHEHPRQARLHRRREHDHAAAGAQRVPAAVPGDDAARTRARSRSGASCSRVCVALVLDTRASKDEILEMYLNDMPLGQRGSFAIVGVPEAARLFFGKDVSNVTLAEAATMAGVLQSPSALSPFNNPDAVPGAPQRRAAGDGRRRLHRRRRSPTRAVARAARRRPARARSRGAVLRRLRRPDARRSVSRA